MKTLPLLMLFLFSSMAYAGNKLPSAKDVLGPDLRPIEWTYDCYRDMFSRKKSCTLTKLFSGVQVGLANDQYTVQVGEQNYSGSQSEIKIDDNAAIYGHEGVSQSPEKVIKQMKTGNVVYVEFKALPDGEVFYGESDLLGFSEKLDEMLEEYAKP